jgi:hypothetical protein
MPKSVSDYLEHLRTVHFTLLLTAVVLGITSFETLGSSRAQALKEFTSIRSAVTDWDSDALRPVMQEIAKALDAKVPNSMSEMWVAYGPPPVFGTITYKDYGLRWFSDGHARLSGHNFRSPLLFQTHFADSNVPLETLAVREPETIAEFRVTWDALYVSIIGYITEGGNIGGSAAVIRASEAIPVTYKVVRAGVRMSGNGITQQPVACGDPHLGEVTEASVSLKELSDASPPLADTTTYGRADTTPINAETPSLALFASCGRDTIVAAVSFDAVRVGGKLQRALQRRYGTDWPIGTFATSFPGLAQVPVELQSLSFDDLQDVLGDETKITSDRIEILGAKIPVDKVIWYGIPILLCIQCYFFLHLRGLRGKIRATEIEPVAWIGIYPDWSARIATLLSVCILPFLVVARLSIISHLQLVQYVGQLVLSIGGSGFLAVMGGIALIEVWRASSAKSGAD